MSDGAPWCGTPFPPKFWKVAETTGHLTPRTFVRLCRQSEIQPPQQHMVKNTCHSSRRNGSIGSIATVHGRHCKRRDHVCAEIPAPAMARIPSSHLAHQVAENRSCSDARPLLICGMVWVDSRFPDRATPRRGRGLPSDQTDVAATPTPRHQIRAVHSKNGAPSVP